MLTLFILLLTSFLYLNYADAKTTYFVVHNSSSRSEKNPIAKYLIDKMGAMAGIIAIKSIIILIIPLVIWTYLESPFSIIILLLCLNTAYLFVVLNNIKVCKKIYPKYTYFKRSKK